MRCEKLIALPASSQFATARHENVLHPFRLAAVCERDDEAVRRSKNIHWRPVDLAGLSSDVGQDAEAGKPACEQPGDPVREGNVDLRQPSLTEPHHEHACGSDGDDYDGSGAHGLLVLAARYATTGDAFSTDCFAGASATSTTPTIA